MQIPGISKKEHHPYQNETDVVQNLPVLKETGLSTHQPETGAVGKKAPHIREGMAAQGKRLSCGTRVRGQNAEQAGFILSTKVGAVRIAQPA